MPLFTITASPAQTSADVSLSENQRTHWFSFTRREVIPQAANKQKIFLYIYPSICLKFDFRRVHISSVTLEHLNGAYKVEEGDGEIRDPYLKQHLVKTYFVINPKVSTTLQGR